jgi:hypothetical protein
MTDLVSLLLIVGFALAMWGLLYLCDWLMEK